MPIFTEGLPTRNNTFLDEYSAGLGESLGQTARETLIRSPVASIFRAGELAGASDPGGYQVDETFDPMTGMTSPAYEVPKKRLFSQEEAADRAKTAGVKLEFPKDGITEDAFNILVERKQDEMRRQDIMTRGPQGFLPGVAKFGTAFGASLLDPINIGSAFIPVVGQARYASLLAAAGSTAGRVLPRLGVGAVEGVVGAAMVEPIIYGAARYEQADYGMADSILNIAFGGVFGGGLHVLGGSGADAFRAWKGKADPFVRLQGLSVDQIKQVREVEKLVGTGIESPEQLVSLVKSYPPEVLRAAGLISDAMPAADVPVAAPRGSIFGEDTQVRIGDRYVPAQWAVVDLADVEATMTKADNQWRDRTRVASDVQIRKIANDPDFEQLQWSPIMDFGAPTLSKDGRVIGGNGRVMGVSTSYDIGRVGPYRDKLNAAIERFGIDASSIEGMSKPMLVRLLREDVDVKKAAILSNEGGSARMSALEQAGVDADRLGDFRGFDIPESGDLNTAANRGAIRQWVGKFPENQQAELVTAEGYLSPQGLLRLRNAILHRAYGDSPVLKSLIEGTDEASTNLTKALTRVAGTIADARGAISRGDLHDLDISGDLQVAVAMLKDLRSKGLDFEGYMAQGDLARAPLDPVQLQLLRYLDDNIASPRAIADLVTSFYDQLRREGDPKQGSLLGDAPVPTKEALLDRAMDQVAEDGSAAAKVEKLSAETREAALRVSVAQMAEGRGVEITPIAEADPSIRTMTPESAKAAAERAASVDNVLAADVNAAEAVEERAAALPKSAGLEAAEKAAEDALAVAEDIAKRGDEAWKYARESADAQKAQAGDVANLTEALRLSFGDSTEALLESGRVKIVDDVNGIPDGPHPADVKGATAPDGTVYIVAKNVTADEAKGLLIHEVGEHVGMEQMLGADVYSKVLAQVAEGIARGDDAFVRAAAMVPSDTLPQHVAGEQLAYLVQHAPELPLVQRIIAAVRAWVYKTFKLAQDNMELTEADFRALAVSSLHAVAKADRAAMEAAAGMVPEFRYSRAGESGPDVKSEMRQFDEAIKRAELYTAAVRAAAERIGDPNAARSAMDAAAGGNLTATEIDDLLAALRSQNTAVRNRLRKARDTVTAEDDAANLQSDAMKAADELANNIMMAAVIEKRNGALNLAARTKALTFVMSEFKGNEAEGVKALLAGSQFKRRGARLSVDAEQKGFEGEWVGGIIADMERENLWRLFTSETMARETARALYLMGDPKADMSGLPKEAVKMAEIIHRYQEDARGTQNRFGAWIRDMKGYIVRQTHDMFRIRAEGFQAWRDFVLPRIDLDKTFYSRGVTDIEAGLREMWSNFAAGQHMKFDPDEELAAAFPGMGKSEARKQSQSRVLYFKDGDNWFDYNERFGAGRFADSVLGGLERASRAAALMKVLGTNPEATLTRLMDEIEDGLRTDPEARARFHEQRKGVDSLFAHVDGRANIPGSHMGAQIGSGLRAWQSMAKLGGAVISSITDIPVYAAEQRFQGRGMLSGMADAIGGLMHGRGSKEQQQILSSLGVFFDSMRNGVARRFDAQENVGGKTSKLMQQFFKWNGLTWWTEVLRGSSALSLSHHLAQNVSAPWGKLSPDLRNLMGLYNIDDAKWDLVRMAATKEADGRMYLTPEGVASVPRPALENYITGIGRTVSDASVQNLVDDLSGALRALYIDRAEHAVIEPDARTRSFLLRGTNPGTVWGETARFIAQFKSFPIAMLQKTMGREVYGRGYDTLGQYLKEGKGDMLGLAHLMLWLTVFGYGAMSVKDMLKGRSPRDPLAAGTWTAAFLQGGGAGIYGDFIFGEMRNRFGGGVLNTVAGPVFGTAEDIMDLYGRVKAGDDAAAKAFRVAVNNTPFLNMFYTRMALDYLLLYNIQEQLNPGYLRRMERRIEKENGQSFLIKPSEVVR